MLKKLRSRQTYSNHVSARDLLFLLVLGFMFLFVLAILHWNPPDSKKIDPKAEVFIILTWPEMNFDDIDLWLELPNGKYVGFKSKDQGYAHLERDDLGVSNDTAIDENGNTTISLQNREVIALRQYVNGHYRVNVQYFRDNNFSVERTLPDGTKEQLHETVFPPMECEVQIVQLNPSYRVLGTYKVIMEKEGDEKTAVEFDVLNGTIVHLENTGDKRFVTPNPENPAGLITPQPRSN